ncbi:hypothetical protein B7494_g586 [Chlorociboria aeruginascens]|nr:hypothetical protein B7494_g586 [Chlorociboria aeruginascens]
MAPLRNVAAPGLDKDREMAQVENSEAGRSGSGLGVSAQAQSDSLISLGQRVSAGPLGSASRSHAPRRQSTISINRRSSYVPTVPSPLNPSTSTSSVNSTGEQSPDDVDISPRDSSSSGEFPNQNGGSSQIIERTRRRGVGVLSPPQQFLRQKSASMLHAAEMTPPGTPRRIGDLGQDYSRYPLSRQSSTNLLGSPGFSPKPNEPLLGPSSSDPSLLRTTAANPFSDSQADIEIWGYPDDRIGAFDPYLGGEKGFVLYRDEIEADDKFHMPADDDDKTLKPKLSDYFDKRQVVSTIGGISLVLGLLCVFILLPVLTFSTNLTVLSGSKGATTDNDGPAWAHVNNNTYPLLKHTRRGLIDPDTPTSAKTRQSTFDGSTLNLVFSDEFNQDNRTFYAGDDPFWTAPNIWYGATGDMEWYDPDAVTTYGGTLQLRMDTFTNHNLAYRSGMLNSWNQLCFKGGIIEVSISLAGPSGVPGLWPGVWSMGNLGRPGYMATTEGIWPYTYNSCDAGITPNQSSIDGISYLPGQKLPSCTCPGEDHPSSGTGRGAPEIDILEASVSPVNKIGVVTQSYQVAPFDIWYRPNHEFMSIPNYNTTSMNAYCGGPYQQAISGTTLLNNDWYDGNAYQKYAYEYIPGSAGKIAWFVGDDPTFMIDGRSIGQNGNINQRLISEEPMSLVFNLGMSGSWSEILIGQLKFPTIMHVDYVRIYQRPGSTIMTCDPPGYPTTEYISNHPEPYNNPNLTESNPRANGKAPSGSNGDAGNGNRSGDGVEVRDGNEDGDGNRNGSVATTLKGADTVRTIGRLKLRGKTDDLPQDWWFASTAIPLLAATIGPLANVLSIAALVTRWRVALPNNGQLPEGTDDAGTGIPDPHWEIILNAISLACGFFGNLCLLFNFTKRIRYIVALPLSIISWYFATSILIGIIVAMNNYFPPVRPGETYSQGFWYAIIAATLYLIGSMILMINMLGYFLGHYPQHFDLDDDQRTLILQTMMFFFWLAGGAAVFQKVCGFSYADALYFCDVTVLTVGFGDFVATNDAGRGLIFPYSVIGIIFLGLMINSIRKFAASMSRDNVIMRHQQRERAKTFGRSVTNEKEIRARLGLPPRKESASQVRKQFAANALTHRNSLDQYGHFDVQGRTITFHDHRLPFSGGGRGGAARLTTPKPPLGRDAKLQQRAALKNKDGKRANRREKLILLKEEKDRFEAMREIQAHTSRFKQYIALLFSALAFGTLWCVGAVVFWIAEHRIQNMSYFEALYFCYVSLLTIGYGDLSPRSNAGKPFFVVWSLVAVPTMTILISDMGDTVISAINRGTFTLADWTVMPKEGVWHDFLQNHSRLRDWLERKAKNREAKTEEREAQKRVEEGFALQDPDEGGETSEDPLSKSNISLEKLAEEPAESIEHDLARKLALAIKKTANDLRADKPKKYSYEEWVEFTRLIRFSSHNAVEEEEEEEEEGLVEWDWIGEDSPMLADVGESEWVLDRLCESLNRYTRRQSKLNRTRHRRTGEPVNDMPQGIQNLDINKSETYPAHPGPRFAHKHTEARGRQDTNIERGEVGSSGSGGRGGGSLEKGDSRKTTAVDGGGTLDEELRRRIEDEADEVEEKRDFAD